MKHATKVVHKGQSTDPTTNAIVPPVYFNSTYFQDGVGHHKGFDYSRADHPNRSQLETALAAIEGATHGACFASGCAAATAGLSMLRPGDHVLASDDLYGGTYRLFVDVFAKWGLSFSFVGANATVSQIKQKIRRRTRLMWIETPTNPLLKVFEIERFAAARGSRKIVLLVDNTFATAMLQRPLSLGADVVLYSTTKYIGGHSDVIGGALVCNDKKLKDAFHFYQKSAGAIPGAMDCFLIHRGLKTLAVRMERHCQNAEHLCSWLKQHPSIQHVYYPSPQDAARNKMTASGGIISFVLKNRNVDTFFKRLKIIRLAESLGGVESLICQPFHMTHGSVPRQKKIKSGITEQLIRLSVGIEDWTDLRDDLRFALKGV